MRLGSLLLEVVCLRRRQQHFIFHDLPTTNRLWFRNVYSGLGNHWPKRTCVKQHVAAFTNRAHVKQALGCEWDLLGNKEDFCLIYSGVRRGEDLCTAAGPESSCFMSLILHLC